MRAVYRSFAKVNLYLAVCGRRADGFHEIDTAMQTVDLCDRLVCTASSDGELSVACAHPEVPPGAGNLVYRALDLLRAAAGRPRAGMRVEIEKRIPLAAGLGGGSGNAACALVAANRLWQLDWPQARLEPLAAEIGADVTFFLRGGTQRGRGRGERVTPLPALPDSRWVIVKPSYGLETGAVYRRASVSLTSSEAKIRMALDLLAKRDLPGLAAAMFNDLASAAEQMRAELGEVRAWMTTHRVKGAMLTGSGSALFGLIHDPGSTAAMENEGRARGWDVVQVRPTRVGCIEEEA